MACGASAAIVQIEKWFEDGYWSSLAPLSPANLFAVYSLRGLAEMTRMIHRDTTLAAECESLAVEVEAAVRIHGRMHDAQGNAFLAYETERARPRKGWVGACGPENDLAPVDHDACADQRA